MTPQSTSQGSPSNQHHSQHNIGNISNNLLHPNLLQKIVCITAPSSSAKHSAPLTTCFIEPNNPSTLIVYRCCFATALNSNGFTTAADISSSRSIILTSATASSSVSSSLVTRHTTRVGSHGWRWRGRKWRHGSTLWDFAHKDCYCAG